MSGKPIDTATPSVESSATKTGPQQDHGLSRRNLLVGTAGLTVGSMVGASPISAQSADPDASPQKPHPASRSDRIYSLNPDSPGQVDVSENPVNVPPAITRNSPATLRIDLETIEIEGHLDLNTRYRFWTFNGTVPGPFQRVRVGDTVEVYLKNNEDSWFAHNVDFHAVTGPGGGVIGGVEVGGVEVAEG